MTFTIEQLEALKEGTTPGPWEWHNNVYDPDERYLHSHNGSMCLSVGDVGSSYFEGDPVLMAAAPALVDALIAEKQAHAKLRADIEALIRDCISSAETFEHNAMTAYSPEACESASTVERDTAAALARILEGDNE